MAERVRLINPECRVTAVAEFFTEASARRLLAPDFSFVVPADLKSGVYAVRLRADDDEFHMPLFVRSRRGAAGERLPVHLGQQAPHATDQPGGATHTASNPFFQNLGTNGRTCFTCHQPQTGWTVSAASAVIATEGCAAPRTACAWATASSAFLSAPCAVSRSLKSALLLA